MLRLLSIQRADLLLDECILSARLWNRRSALQSSHRRLTKALPNSLKPKATVEKRRKKIQEQLSASLAPEESIRPCWEYPDALPI